MFLKNKKQRIAVKAFVFDPNNTSSSIHDVQKMIQDQVRGKFLGGGVAVR